MSERNGLPIILASASPRRLALFRALQIPCEVVSAEVDEASIPYKTPRELALKAAYAKVCAVESRFAQGLLVAADTIVVLDGRVFGKPVDEDDARRMLSELSGRSHVVISGIAVKEIGRAALLDAVETPVHIRPMTSREIEDYVASGEPLDKAGSYAVQGIGRRFVEKIAGDYYNVVGLPVGRLLEMMDNFVDTAAYRSRISGLPEIFPQQDC